MHFKTEEKLNTEDKNLNLNLGQSRTDFTSDRAQQSWQSEHLGFAMVFARFEAGPSRPDLEFCAICRKLHHPGRPPPLHCCSIL